jgi:membrane-associated protease RseP (regulator of RpoE activity)
VNPLEDVRLLANGLPFSATLMGILLVHEMGHYVMSRIHGVEATPPYFIPGPAVSGRHVRRVHPHAHADQPESALRRRRRGTVGGFLVAIPAVFYGLSLSKVSALDPTSGGVVLGDSFVFSWLTQLALGCRRTT